MYDFARGPLVWIAFAILIIGTIYRLVSAYMLAKKDKVVLPYMKWKFGLRSIAHWIVPFGSKSMRMRPVFTILSFLFHACLLLTPIFTLGHVALWRESWGLNWWTLPDGLSFLMTLIVILGGVMFFMRRIADPTVRFVTSWHDFALILVVVAPFATGLMAHFHIFAYKPVITIHMFTGALWLAVIPFTRVVHMIFFPFTRAYMGNEFGYVRHSRDW